MSPSPLQNFRTYRRRRIKRFGKKLTRSLEPFFGRHSRVGDPMIFKDGDFAFTEELTRNWQTIRDEALKVTAEPERLPRLQEISRDNKKIAGQGVWRIFFFYGFGTRVDRSCDLCPATAALLDRIPGIQNAWFSVLEGGAHVPRHRGITKGLIRCHLSLVVPDRHEECFIEIDGHRHAWKEGETLVFDDTRPHEVHNGTDQTRTILLIDFDRPLDRVGRLVSRAFIAAMRRTAYVRDAAKKLAAWEKDYHREAPSQAEVTRSSGPSDEERKALT